MRNTLRPRGAPPDEVGKLVQPAHVAIVEDDLGARTVLSRLLRAGGYDVTGASSGEELAELMQHRPIDLVLLDIDLPEQSDFAMCAKLRRGSRVPIIIVSASGAESDRVAGLDLGADDYIVKPFSHLELLARVRALLRRATCPHAQPASPIAEEFLFAGWRYRPSRHRLTAPSGADIELTSAEHQLLVTLLRHPGRMIGRDRLLELTRSRVGGRSDRSVDVLISRLRRKLADGEHAPPLIRTVRGVGYMLATEVRVA